MRPETAQQALHLNIPEWDDSIVRARRTLGFEFGRSRQENWAWLQSGGYTRVWATALHTVRSLGLDDHHMTHYWVHRFFSDYVQGQVQQLELIKGPPFLEISCPSDHFGPRWEASIKFGKRQLSKLAGEVPQYEWLQLGGMARLAKVARQQVEQLGTGPCVPQWLCCVVPDSQRLMVSRAGFEVSWLPYAEHWDYFRCSYREERYRQRAFPTGIDWRDVPESVTSVTNEGLLARKGNERVVDMMHQMTELQLKSFEFSTGSGGLNLNWDGALATEADAKKASSILHRQFRNATRAGSFSNLASQVVHSVKQPRSVKIQNARARYASETATFRDLLIEEARSEEVQDSWREYKQRFRGERLRKHKKVLAKTVYDRVRRWLVQAGHSPRLDPQQPSWPDEAFPDDV